MNQLDSTQNSYSKLKIIIDKRLLDYATSFKRNKVEDLSAIVREVAQLEVENSNQQASFWSRALQDPKLSSAGQTNSYNIAQ